MLWHLLFRNHPKTIVTMWTVFDAKRNPPLWTKYKIAAIEYMVNKEKNQIVKTVAPGRYEIKVETFGVFRKPMLSMTKID